MAFFHPRYVRKEKVVSLRYFKLVDLSLPVPASFHPMAQRVSHGEHVIRKAPLTAIAAAYGFGVVPQATAGVLLPIA